MEEPGRQVDNKVWNGNQGRTDSKGAFFFQNGEGWYLFQ